MTLRNVLVVAVCGALVAAGLLGCQQAGESVSAGEKTDCSATCEALGDGSQCLVTCEGPDGKSEMTVTCNTGPDGEVTVACDGCPAGEVTATCQSTDGGDLKCTVVHNGEQCSADCPLHTADGAEVTCAHLASDASGGHGAAAGVCPGAAESADPSVGCPKSAAAGCPAGVGGICPASAASDGKTTDVSSK
jgi:hypothetical protein